MRLILENFYNFSILILMSRLSKQGSNGDQLSALIQLSLSLSMSSEVPTESPLCNC